MSHVAFQSLSSGEPLLASCAVGGTVQLCDLRKAGESYLMYRSHNICALTAHATQPIVAVGSRKQSMKLYNLHAR